MHNLVWCRKLIKRQLLPVPRSIHYLSSCDIINNGRTTTANLIIELKSNWKLTLIHAHIFIHPLIHREVPNDYWRSIWRKYLFTINASLIVLCRYTHFAISKEISSEAVALNFLWTTDISYFSASQNECTNTIKRHSHGDNFRTVQILSTRF